MIYRVVTTHDPHEQTWPWLSRIFDSAGVFQRVEQGSTPEESEDRARAWIVRENHPREQSRELWLDAHGHMVLPPDPSHSVRV